MKESHSPRRFISNEIKMQAQFFHGETEAWRRERYANYREVVNVVELLEHTKQGLEHNVAWLERVTIDPDTNERQVFYHAACSCVAYTEDAEDPDLSPMLQCYGLQGGLLLRAEEERGRNPMSLADMLGISVRMDLSSPLESLDPQDEAILLELRKVKNFPNKWAGNLRGGMHEAPLLSVITGWEESEIIERAHRLKDQGLVAFDGEQTIQLAA